MVVEKTFVLEISGSMLIRGAVRCNIDHVNEVLVRQESLYNVTRISEKVFMLKRYITKNLPM